MRKMTTSVLGAAVAGLLLVLGPAGASGAEAPRKLGVYGSWEAWTYAEGRGKVCYLVSRPRETAPKNVRRNEIHVMVSHRTATKVRNEVGVYLGYPLKPSSTVEATVGNSRFLLFTRDDAAWAIDAKVDKDIVDAMAKGARLVIKGTSARGTETTDTYPLTGFVDARKAIDKACAD